MKRMGWKRGILALAALVILMMAAAVTANADPVNEVQFTKNLVVRTSGVSRVMQIKQLKGATNLKATSSNKKMSVYIDPADEYYKYPYIYIRFRNNKGQVMTSGKSTLTVSGKVNGKTKKLKINVTLQKGSFINPFKSFKIGTKEFKKNFNKGTWWVQSYQGTYNYYDDEDYTYIPNALLGKIIGKKIKITPASGWKILKIEQMIFTRNGENYSSKRYTLKNGKTTKTLPANAEGCTFYVQVMNTKTKLQEEALINF